MLATALQIIRADELFYWLTPRLERGIATITGAPPRVFFQLVKHFDSLNVISRMDRLLCQTYPVSVPTQGENGRRGSQASWGAVL